METVFAKFFTNHVKPGKQGISKYRQKIKEMLGFFFFNI